MPPRLPLFSSKTTSTPIDPTLSVFCSPHDLIAIVTADSDIVIYRLNGQIAFTIKCKDPGELNTTAVQWKPDGSLLAVGWSDGSWGIYEGGSGRLVGEGRIVAVQGGEEWKLDLEPGWGGDEEGGVGVRGFGWERHVVGLGGGKQQSGGAGRELDTEAWADGLEDDLDDLQLDDGGAKGQGVAGRLADLPRAIATLDPTRVLPRLSAIPSHGLRSGPEGNRFGTQAATDGVFESSKEDVPDSIDVVLVYTSTGEAQMLLDETVPIGSFSLASNPLNHASHARSGSHVLLSQAADDRFQCHVQDLPLKDLSGPLLHVIARDTKRIQSTLAYLTQTIRCITHDYANGLQFPTRLMNNISMTLSEAEKPTGNLTDHLTHLAMTGHFSPPILEWLTDIIKEPNHKRWDQAIGGMYAHIQNHAFINIAPALDHMSFAVCSLRGQAMANQDNPLFSVEPSLFTNILQGIDALRLVSQKVQLLCAHEWQQFRAFSKWLRLQIEIGIAGPYSKNALEAEEKEISNIDYTLVLGYIRETITASKLATFVQKPAAPKGSCGKEQFFEQLIVRQMGYERTKEALEKLGPLGEESFVADKVDNTAVLNLQAIAVSLTGHVRVAMEAIAKWQSGMLPPPTVMDYSDIRPQVYDMRLLAPSIAASPKLAVLSTDAETLYLHSSHLPLTAQPDVQTLLPSRPSELLAAKFVSHNRILLLRRSDEDGTHVLASVELSNDTSPFGEERVLHTFKDAEHGFAPERLLVGGRPGKEVCVVFGDGGRAWRVLDLAAMTVVKGGDVEMGSVDDSLG